MVPDMILVQRCWVALSKKDTAAAAGILETIKERSMAPWYAHLHHHHPALFPLDEALLAKMKEANEAESKRLSEVKENTKQRTGGGGFVFIGDVLVVPSRMTTWYGELYDEYSPIPPPYTRLPADFGDR